MRPRWEWTKPTKGRRRSGPTDVLAKQCSPPKRVGERRSPLGQVKSLEGLRCSEHEAVGARTPRVGVEAREAGRKLAWAEGEEQPPAWPALETKEDHERASRAESEARLEAEEGRPPALKTMVNLYWASRVESEARPEPERSAVAGQPPVLEMMVDLQRAEPEARLVRERSEAEEARKAVQEEEQPMWESTIDQRRASHAESEARPAPERLGAEEEKPPALKTMVNLYWASHAESEARPEPER